MSTPMDESADDSDGQTRRNLLKTVGVTASTGALGALAGCSGQSDEGGSDGESDMTEGGDTTDASGESGSQGTTTVNYLAAMPTENPRAENHFRESFNSFEEQNPEIRVELSAQSYSGLNQQLGASVSSGNPPDVAQAGSSAVNYWLNDDTLTDHGPFLEETSLLEDWTSGNKRAANFRGQYYSLGAPTHQPMQMGFVPEFFREVGIEDPETELETWTQVHRALEAVDEEFSNVTAFEETGVPADVESYWSQARTAYTDGADPWIQNSETLLDGNPEDPELMIGSSDRTDGMIKACVQRAQQFSTPGAATRGDEGTRPLMVQGQVASFTYAQGRVQAWELLNEDIEFGWENGDIYQRSIPRVDANYGDEIGIPELSGVEGEHGGQLLTMEYQDQIFPTGNEESAFSVIEWMQTTPEFIVPLAGEHFVSVPSNTTLYDAVKSEYGYGDSMPQIQENIFDSVEEYGSQFVDCGVWDVGGVDQIRWTDIGETLSEAHAGDHSVEETPGVIADRVSQTLEEQNQGLELP
jgi:ABC-type sugar transport system, periplasmic component